MTNPTVWKAATGALIALTLAAAKREPLPEESDAESNRQHDHDELRPARNG